MDLKFKTMKKLFITAAIATMFSVTAFADGGKKATEASEKNVTLSALNQFKADFKVADNVIWTVTPNCQKVNFVANDVNYTAFYDLKGEYLGYTQVVDYATLSAEAKKDIAKGYADYEVKDVIKYVTLGFDEPVVYFVDIKKADRELVLKVTPDNSVAYFQTVRK